MLTGIQYLHVNNIIHRDIKPSNIFLNGSDLVIGDFGKAKLFNDENTQKPFSKCFGILPYNAPEVLREQSYSNAVDIWSFGCVLYEMIKLERLFNQNTELINSISSFEISTFLSNTDIEPIFVTILKKYN